MVQIRENHLWEKVVDLSDVWKVTRTWPMYIRAKSMAAGFVFHVSGRAFRGQNLPATGRNLAKYVIVPVERYKIVSTS